MVAAIQISHLQKSVRTDAELGGGVGVKLRRAYELLEPFKVGGSSSGGASFFHRVL